MMVVFHMIKRKQKYGDIPIYITENGHGAYDVADENGWDFNETVNLRLRGIPRGSCR